MKSPRLAKDIMVTQLVTLSPETHVVDGIAHLLRHNITGAPVVNENMDYLGVFSEKCCMNVLLSTRHWMSQHEEPLPPPILARDFMVTDLATLTPEMDVFEAVNVLLSRHISGAPVTDQKRIFLGVFSEKTCMSMLIAAAYDQMPTSTVGAFMNRDTRRIISADIDHMAITQVFTKTPYRRLPVVHDGKLAGQICRRDVLRAPHHLSELLRSRLQDTTRSGSDSQAVSAESLHGLDDEKRFVVATFMDVYAKAIDEKADLLQIAQVFLNTPYRRLPVLREGKLVGQISRRDLLEATFGLMEPPTNPSRHASLFLSAVIDRSESPIPY